MGFRLVRKTMTLNGVLIANPRYLCGSWASCCCCCCWKDYYSPV